MKYIILLIFFNIFLVNNLFSDEKKCKDLIDKPIEWSKCVKDKSIDLSKKGSKKLNTEKGTYMQPMLIDQIRYLQSMLSRADQKPGKDALIRLKELKSEFKILKNKLS